MWASEDKLPSPEAKASPGEPESTLLRQYPDGVKTCLVLEVGVTISSLKSINHIRGLTLCVFYIEMTCV